MLFFRNMFPKPESSTSWLKAFWCRWFHKGDRSSSGMPAAGKYLHHSIWCFRCGARYEIVRPNTPQYGCKMPFQKPDRSKPTTWDEYWVEKQKAKHEDKGGIIVAGKRKLTRSESKVRFAQKLFDQTGESSGG